MSLATAFYDAALAPLGLRRFTRPGTESSTGWAGWGTEGTNGAHGLALWVCAPFNGHAATVGNGTMVPESRRPPYPITWDEQDRLFPRLPAHLQRMALFAVNTGLRDSNVCGLQWTWEVPLPELGRSVFVVPAESFKSKRDHVVILNDAAWSIVQAQRGLHPIWVFPFRGHRIDSMNNTGWQNARRAAGLGRMRVHDLRHTFACRLPPASCGRLGRGPRRVAGGTRSTRCRGTTRAPTSGACSSSQTWCSAARKRAPCCA